MNYWNNPTNVSPTRNRINPINSKAHNCNPQNLSPNSQIHQKITLCGPSNHHCDMVFTVWPLSFSGLVFSSTSLSAHLSILPFGCCNHRLELARQFSSSGSLAVVHGCHLWWWVFHGYLFLSLFINWREVEELIWGLWLSLCFVDVDLACLMYMKGLT